MKSDGMQKAVAPGMDMTYKSRNKTLWLMIEIARAWISDGGVMVCLESFLILPVYSI